MGIALDATSSGTASSASSPLVYSHTCTGVDLILFVSVIDTSGDTVTGITYNGVAMTQITKCLTGGVELYLYYLINPATGAHNVSVSYTGIPTVVSSYSASYTGALQSGQPDAFNSATGNSGTASVATTVVAQSCWLVTTAINDTANFNTPGTNIVERVPGTGSSFILGDSNGTVSTGSVTASVTITGGSPQWGIISASFAPAPTLGGGNLMMMGV